MEERRKRVAFPGAEPQWAAQAEHIFGMLQTFLQSLPREVHHIGDKEGHTEEETGAKASTDTADTNKTMEIDEDEWSEDDFDSIEIDTVPGETDVQRRERKKIMCRQMRQVQNKVALRKKEKNKTASTKNVDNKQKCNKDATSKTAEGIQEAQK